MPKKHLVMLIDIKRCIGCHTCCLACKVENNLPDGNWWNRTVTVGGDEMDTPAGVFPNLSLSYHTLACQHCESPPCVEVCPVDATFKREEDGVVIQDYALCIGCLECIAACPYEGVRMHNAEAPKYELDFSVGDAAVPKHRENVVEKCTFCTHRLEKNIAPFCVEVCPARARHFGDLNDPGSTVKKLLERRSHFQLQPEKGTKPSVYFLT